MVYRLFVERVQLKNHHLSLSSEQQHYLRRVLRLKVGERFVAMDGKGCCWLVKLTSSGGEILEALSEDNELPLEVTLIVALPKGNGFEEIVRCTTELGVRKLMPIISERTLLQPSDRKLSRWRKIATEAAEQSERQIIPQIFAPISFNQVITEISLSYLNSHCYLAVARKNAPSLGKILLAAPELNKIVIATGPEGGWTEQEIEKAITCGFQPVSLGKRILRSITAPIMAMSLVAGISENDTTI